MSGEEPGKAVRPPSRPALSPSRAADFKQCPLLYRFRAIDRLPEPPSTAQLRGSVVHAALEQLYHLPATQRGPQTAGGLVGAAWDQVIAAEPELAGALDTEGRRNCSTRPARCCPAITGWKIQPGSTRRAASNASRSSLPMAHCCAASSTGSTSPTPASCGWSTTRPARPHR